MNPDMLKMMGNNKGMEQLAKYEAGQYERWALGNTPYSIKCN